jgi:hypothetical protein
MILLGKNVNNKKIIDYNYIEKWTVLIVSRIYLRNVRLSVYPYIMNTANSARVKGNSSHGL